MAGYIIVMPCILLMVWAVYVIFDADRSWWSRILLGGSLVIASLVAGLGAMWVLDLTGLAEFSGGPR